MAKNIDHFENCNNFFYFFKDHSYALTYKPHFKGIFSFFKYFKFNMGSFGCL